MGNIPSRNVPADGRWRFFGAPGPWVLGLRDLVDAESHRTDRLLARLRALGRLHNPGVQRTSEWPPSDHDPAVGALVPKSLAKKRPRSELVPLRAYYSFGYESVAQKAQETLKHANAQLESDVMLKKPLLDSLFEILANEKFEATEIHLLALEKGFMHWPMAMMVPLLDVFRLALLNPQVNEYFCSSKDGNRAAATMLRFSTLLIEGEWRVRMLVCRSLANAAAHEDGRQMLQQELSSKPAFRFAAATAFANFALILLRQTEKCQELGPREDVLRAIIKSTESVHSFGGLTELALFRLLQAIATLMWGAPAVITLAKQRGICEIVNRIKDAVQSDDSKNIARDIFVMTTAV
ncbi:WD domain-containing protein [Aphelenchoides fujianensis]|nr:WD domain-containing protein [Aphelenchoides fujianensis]